MAGIPSTSSLLTPGKISLLALLFPVFYAFGVGVERFYFESLGTLVLSPMIYIRLAPEPLSEWLLRAFVSSKAITGLFVAIPIAMIGLSMIFAVLGTIRKSLGMALIALLLVGSVFSVYHHIQPMGLTLQHDER